MAVQDHQQLLRLPLPNAASCQQMMLIIIWVIDWLCPIRVSWAPITLPRASQQQRFPQSPDSSLDVDNIIMCPYWTVYRSCSCGSGVVVAVAWVAWMNSFHSSNKPLIAFPTHLCRSYFIALSEGRPHHTTVDNGGAITTIYTSSVHIICQLLQEYLCTCT